MYTKDEIIEEAKKLGKMMSETEQVEFFKKRKLRFMKIRKSAKKWQV